MKEKKNFESKSVGIIFAALLIFAAFGIMPAAADVLPGYNLINITPANDIRFDDYGDNSYFINWTKTNGGLNATHISDTSSNLSGQVTDTGATSGTFYITDVGNRSFQDDIILLVAVNSSNTENFSLSISSSGYQWTPAGNGLAPPESAVNYNSTAMSATFTDADFTENQNDVFQNWKPGPSQNYPIYSGDTDLYNLMFIDTCAGIFGNVTDLSTLTDNGSVKVGYNISGLSKNSKVVFNAYSWNEKTYDWKNNQIKYDVPGIRWTNDVSGVKTNANVWRVTVP